MKKTRGSYLVNGALAGCVLYFVLDLSRSGRGVIDWIVIAAVCLAILWNILRLGQRLYQYGGGRALWHLQRTLLFWVIGIFNTFLLSSEDVGTWRAPVGWAFLVLAALDSIVLYRKERASVRPLDSA